MSTTSSNLRRLAAIACLATWLGSAASLKPYEAVEPHMGTLVRIKLYAPSGGQAEAAFQAAFQRIGQLDATLSDYRADSELNTVCRTAVRHPVRVSADLFRVLEASQQLAQESGGAFDVTMGPVIRLWRAARKTGRVPDTAEIAVAARTCGYRKLHLNAAHRTAMLDEAGMELDLGGIAKGYAADEAVAVLKKMGIRSALVAASGDLAFSDAPPGESGWKIGIDSFDRADAPFTKVLELADAAVSTSGDSEQHLDSGGKRYSHIVDPATGVGLTREITVTIVAPRGIEADGLSTAVSVLGPERGLELVARRRGVAALMVTRDAAGAHVTESARMRRYSRGR